MICEDKEPVALVLGGAGFIGKVLCCGSISKGW
jgi:nucleoside-diphosphate-sugar epimerase